MTNQRRRLTLDFAGADPEKGNARFYTTEQLGPKQSLTPEGFLLCQDVPLARPGEMIYGPDETPIEAGPDGITRITRTSDELLRPETLASFNGKPVTNEHPDDDVTPATWKDLTVGVLLNPRAGSGEYEGWMVGDLLITDKDAIQDVRQDKREVSLGYDADYRKTGPGRGVQADILGNHVALVDRGRCGPRCAIHDHETQPTSRKENNMGATVKGLPPSRRRLSATAVRRVLDNAMEEVERMEGGEQMTLRDAEGEYGRELDGDGLQHIHIHLNESSAPAGQTGALGVEKAQDEFPNDEGQDFPTKDDPYEQRFQKIEGAIGALTEAIQQLMGGGGAPEAPGRDQFGHGEPDGDEPGSAAQAPGNSPYAGPIKDAEAEELAEELESAGQPMTRDAARKVRDSEPLGSSYQNLVADCEILVPGFRVPTYDAAAHPVDTIQRMCNTRKKALDLAYMTAAGKKAIDTALRGRTFDTSTMDCRCIRKTFDAAVILRAASNNAPERSGVTVAHTGTLNQAAHQLVSGEDLNNLYKQAYGRK